MTERKVLKKMEKILKTNCETVWKMLEKNCWKKKLDKYKMLEKNVEAKFWKKNWKKLKKFWKNIVKNNFGRKKAKNFEKKILENILIEKFRK